MKMSLIQKDDFVFATIYIIVQFLFFGDQNIYEINFQEILTLFKRKSIHYVQ